jgi:hypothetical protein
MPIRGLEICQTVLGGVAGSPTPAGCWCSPGVSICRPASSISPTPSQLICTPHQCQSKETTNLKHVPF